MQAGARLLGAAAETSMLTPVSAPAGVLQAR